MKAVTLEWHLDVLRMSTHRIRKGGIENETKKRDGISNKLVNMWCVRKVMRLVLYFFYLTFTYKSTLSPSK